MKRMTIWFVLSIKRWLRHPGFTALLLIMPVVLWGIHRLEPEETSRIRIGVVSEDGGRGTEVVKDLVEMGKAGSMFEFVPYATEEELKKEVQTKAAECGYLFPEGFEETLEQGQVQALYYGIYGSVYHIRPFGRRSGVFRPGCPI